jgi:2-polyprenyl-3-methyl-5-hydroxy-6-metoxy-1,4-benzoquinol methylase
MLVSALTGDPLENPIYDSQSDKSITSLSQIVNGNTKVYYDPKIGHLQTNEIANVNKYYDEDYKFFDQSDEDDILYRVIDGKKIFRQQHQVETLLSKVTFQANMKILDYGCAKGTVLKRLYAKMPDIIPYLFDVSQMYVPLWKKFLKPEQYASYRPKEEWVGLFDVITSFFAFEHTPDPLKELASIKKLIKSDGLIYVIVPNVFENSGDFIVADHIHHYSEISLGYMFQKAGFEIMEIDGISHFGAYIVIARNSNQILSYRPDSKQLETNKIASQHLADYWSDLQQKINEFEIKSGQKKAVIYGAGVYGNFIASSLKDFSKVESFVDQNPLLQNEIILGKQVKFPENISDDIQIIYVGLNPTTAKAAIENLNFDKSRFSFFYL